MANIKYELMERNILFVSLLLFPRVSAYACQIF